MPPCGRELPLFPAPAQKNDALFLYGATRPKPFVMSYPQEEIEVVHGPSCKPEIEIHLDRCAHDGIPVVRRRSGGGTVVLAPGMVVTIVVGERRRGEDALEVFGRIHDAMVGILDPDKRLDLRRTGISDLALGDRKVLGSSLYMQATPFLYYYQSSLMVDADLALIDRYLAHPPREPEYRQGRPHADFCTTLRQDRRTSDPSATALLISARLPSEIS